MRWWVLALAIALSCNGENGLQIPDQGPTIPDLGLPDGDMITCTLPGVCLGGWLKHCWDSFMTVGFFLTSDGSYFPCASPSDCDDAQRSARAHCEGR